MKIPRGIWMATGTFHSCLCHRTNEYRSSGHRHPRHAHRQMWLQCVALGTLGSQPSVQSGGHGQLPLLCLIRRDLVSLMLPKPPPHPHPLSSEKASETLARMTTNICQLLKTGRDNCCFKYENRRCMEIYISLTRLEINCHFLI